MLEDKIKNSLGKIILPISLGIAAIGYNGCETRSKTETCNVFDLSKNSCYRVNKTNNDGSKDYVYACEVGDECSCTKSTDSPQDSCNCYCRTPSCCEKLNCSRGCDYDEYGCFCLEKVQP